MINALYSAVSGLVAQQKRLDASASNVANARSSGALPSATGASTGRQAYQPIDTVQTSAPGADTGTVATYQPVKPAYVPAYDPASPDANQDGLVAMPNVDPLTETVNQLTAQQNFAANLKTVQAALSMTDQLLKLDA